jgi:hypothetical protein
VSERGSCWSCSLLRIADHSAVCTIHHYLIPKPPWGIACHLYRQREANPGDFGGQGG